MTGSALVVVGAQWGDEGKGKVVDLRARDADVIVRYQGGTNAGHTLVVGGRKTVLHLVPAGILHPDKVCCIGPGCVVDPEALLAEVDMLVAAGVSVTPERLRIAATAHLVLPSHKQLDRAREAAAGAARIGTTGRGIGPAYEDAVARRGLRFVDVDDPAHLRARLEAQLAEKRIVLAALGEPAPDVEAMVGPLLAACARLRPFLGDVGRYLEGRLAAGARVVFEGAQGTMLDVLHGTYPYVTSSSTLSGNAAAGAGVAPTVIGRVLGVTKAYTTRVGEGPFPTEETGEVGERLRAVGREFGATTGRPRRCGWLDVPALRYAARLNGLTELALTKLDVLAGLDEVPVAVAYDWRGQRLDELPMHPAAASEARPVYERLAGWDASLAGARTWDALPATARAYVERLEALTGLPVTLVSVGPGRDEIVERA